MRRIYFFASAVFLGIFGLYGLLAADGLESQKRAEVFHADAARPQVRLEDAASRRAEAADAKRIKLTFEGGEAFAVLYDNPTSRDFASMLSLTLRFRDFNGAEKIAYPPRALTLGETPLGFAPSAGDLTVFAPWGNLAIFYRDGGYSGDLASVGRLTSGAEALAATEGDFSVRAELIE